MRYRMTTRTLLAVLSILSLAACDLTKPLPAAPTAAMQYELPSSAVVVNRPRTAGRADCIISDASSYRHHAVFTTQIDDPITASYVLFEMAESGDFPMTFVAMDTKTFTGIATREMWLPEYEGRWSEVLYCGAYPDGQNLTSPGTYEEWLPSQIKGDYFDQSPMFEFRLARK